MLFYSLGFYLFYSIAFRKMQISHVRYYKVKRAQRREPPIRYLFDAVMFGFLFCAISTLNRQPVRALPMIIGAFLVVVGYFVGDWAMRYLGKNYVDGVGLHNKHELVTDGPYRYVRHPLYVSIAISYVGLSIFSWNAYLAMSLLSSMFVFLFRALGEDHLLRQRLPDQYNRYFATTGMLIPRIRMRG